MRTQIRLRAPQVICWVYTRDGTICRKPAVAVVHDMTICEEHRIERTRLFGRDRNLDLFGEGKRC